MISGVVMNFEQVEGAWMFTCPCCGYQVFESSPGSYDICPICFWEDDAAQLYYPEQEEGANACSLIKAQVNFVQFGACKRDMASHVRPVTLTDTRDPLWFPLWERRVVCPDQDECVALPESLSVLCYWLRL